MKKEQKTRALKAVDPREPAASDLRSKIHRAITDGFGEYRRQIAAIRERHGRKARGSLQLLG